jgi:hypothetical protein
MVSSDQRVHSLFGRAGINLFVGRRTHRLFRDAGMGDIPVDAVVHVYPLGHDRRPILRDFVNNVREGLIEGSFITRSDLESDMIALERYLSDPEALVTSHPILPAVGPRPAVRVTRKSGRSGPSRVATMALVRGTKRLGGWPDCSGQP